MVDSPTHISPAKATISGSLISACIPASPAWLKANNMPIGRIARMSGRNKTVNSTSLFLKTSDHSLPTIVRILSMFFLEPQITQISQIEDGASSICEICGCSYLFSSFIRCK